MVFMAWVILKGMVIGVLYDEIFSMILLPALVGLGFLGSLCRRAHGGSSRSTLSRSGGGVRAPLRYVFSRGS